MQSAKRLATRPAPNPGELVVPLPVFPVSEEEEPTAQARLVSQLARVSQCSSKSLTGCIW
jgi:hypothetical protein